MLLQRRVISKFGLPLYFSILASALARRLGARLVSWRRSLIPSPIDQNPCAHWRNPIDSLGSIEEMKQKGKTASVKKGYFGIVLIGVVAVSTLLWWAMA